MAKPDDTWSPWSKEAAAAPPGARPASAAVGAPMARYLQYRLTLTAAPRGADSPVIREVLVSYLQANQPPVIAAVAENGQTAKPAKPAKGKNGKRAAKPASGNPGKPSGMKVTWQVSDPNGDAMQFRLFFRGEGEKAWKPLADDLKAPQYVWNTDAVPDGRYRLKVEATDAPANTPERALTASRTSDVIVVDRTAPTVTLVKLAVVDATTRQLELKARDNLADVVSAAWSLDGADWMPALPVDKIFDADSEGFLVTVKGLKPGEHTFVLRVEDSEGNTGAGKVVFEVK